MTASSRQQSAPGPRRFTPPFAVSPRMVTSDSELAELCERWRRLPALGVDTEFMRDRSFYPKLGLIQVGDGEDCALVDPLEIRDFEPLRDVLTDRDVVKIFHSCGEDLETLFHRFGAMPEPIFDTQLAAALAGHGSSVGYGNLVLKLSGIDLPKGETRSNWLQRPLTLSQQAYAALDVAYLPPLYGLLRSELDAADRLPWLEEEVSQLRDSERFLPDPETIYRKIGHPGMSPRDLGVLRELCLWRELQARSRNLPRNFIVPKAALVELALRKPRSWRQLERLPTLRPPVLKRHGHAILGLIKKAIALPSQDLPRRLPRPLDLSPYRQQVQDLRRAVAERAETLGIPPELLANKRTAEALVRHRVRAEATDPLADGWRRPILEPLVAAVQV